MTIRTVSVQRFSVTSHKPFSDVVAAFEAAISHPDMSELHRQISGADSYAEVERAVSKATRGAELIEFMRLDLGKILRKKRATAPHSLRFIVGNPVIMSQMVERVADAGSYAPVTILIDERSDGVPRS